MEINYLLFRSGGRTIALDASLARQVVPLENLAALPGTQQAFLGLTAALGRALPVVNLPALADWHDAQTEYSLALICEIGSETLALPIKDVIGFVREDSAPKFSGLLSEETLLGGYLGGGQRGQILNAQLLLASVQGRILSA